MNNLLLLFMMVAAHGVLASTSMAVSTQLISSQAAAAAEEDPFQVCMDVVGALAHGHHHAHHRGRKVNCKSYFPRTSLGYKECKRIKKTRHEIKRLVTDGVSTETICNLGQPPAVNTADKCTACRSAAKFISACVRYGNTTLEVIEAGARIACAAELGKEVEPACDLIINRMNDILQWIGEGMTPEDICKQLHLCTSERPVAVLEPRVPLQEDIVTCMFCQQTASVIKAAEPYGDQTFPLIKQGMAALCAYLPGAACDQLLENFDKLAALVVKGEDQEKACADVGMCDASLKPTEEWPSLFLQTPDLPCVLCESVGGSIRAVGKYDDTSVLKQGLSDVCAILPEDSQCEDLVPKFDDLSKAIQTGLSPSDACVKVGMCKQVLIIEPLPILEPLPLVPRLDPVRDTTTQGDDSSCILCSTMCHVMEDVDLSSVEMLKPKFRDVCENLPVSSKCDLFFMQFDNLVKDISTGMTVDAACAMEGLCYGKVFLESI